MVQTWLQVQRRTCAFVLLRGRRCRHCTSCCTQIIFFRTVPRTKVKRSCETRSTRRGSDAPPAVHIYESSAPRSSRPHLSCDWGPPPIWGAGTVGTAVVWWKPLVKMFPRDVVQNVPELFFTYRMKPIGFRPLDTRVQTLPSEDQHLHSWVGVAHRVVCAVSCAYHYFFSPHLIGSYESVGTVSHGCRHPELHSFGRLDSHIGPFWWCY